ncbi:MAG: glucose 1-dehydrogenase, partial [Planctomycetota bacterium]
VLVTGGTSGIGRDIVVAFVREGANVVFTGRREAEGKATADAASGPGRAVFQRGDVLNEADIEAAVARVGSEFGKLDVAVNNAGVETVGMLTDLKAEDIDRVLGINVRGVLLSMKHEIPAMGGPESGSGSIINMASIAGHIGMPGASVYMASKHAVLGITKSAGLELAKSGIRVNAVSPGGIRTEMLDRFTGGSSEGLDQMAGMHPMGRVGEVREITDPVLFLASDESSFITGTDIVADGGFLAQ